jgi:hypothetical protein
MNNGLVLLSFFLAFVIPVFAREKTDIIVMKRIRQLYLLV